MRKGTANPKTAWRTAYYAKLNDITQHLHQQDELLQLIHTDLPMFRCRLLFFHYFESCCWFVDQGFKLEFSMIHGSIFHDLTTNTWKVVDSVKINEK